MRASVLLPVFNEERRIVACLRSLAAQTLPKPDYEIIVADGGSTDATRALIRAFAERNLDLNLRLIDNPRRTTAAGLNEAIQVATGDILARVDGHSVLPTNYLEEMDKTLAEPAVWAAGAAVVNADPDPEAAALWAAVTSPFGCGGSDYRTPGAVREVASVQGAAYRRDAVEKIGPFDEAMLHAEDEDYNWRVRQAGGKVILRGDLQLGYYPRRTVRDLGTQMHQYGRGRVRMLRKYPGYLRWQHLAPPLFVAGLDLGAVLLFAMLVLTLEKRVSGWMMLIPLAPLLVYQLLVLVAHWRMKRSDGWFGRLLIERAFFAIHHSYGRGFLIQLFSRKKRNERVAS